MNHVYLYVHQHVNEMPQPTSSQTAGSLVPPVKLPITFAFQTKPHDPTLEEAAVADLGSTGIFLDSTYQVARCVFAWFVHERFIVIRLAPLLHGLLHHLFHEVLLMELHDLPFGEDHLQSHNMSCQGHHV